MDFWVKAERIARRSNGFLSNDWRIAVVNPTHLLDFRAKGLSMREIQGRVDREFTSGSFPVKIKIDTPEGKMFNLSRSGMIPDDTICTGTISNRGQRFLTFDLSR